MSVRVGGLRVRGLTLAYVVLEDLLLVITLVGASLAIWGPGDEAPTIPEGQGIILVAAVLAALKAIFFATGLYEFRRFPRRIAYWRNLGLGLVLFAAAAWVTLGYWGQQGFTYYAFVATFVPGVIVGRLGFAAILRLAPWRRRVLFLGTGRQAQRTATALMEHPEWMHRVVGFCSEEGDEPGFRVGEAGVLGRVEDVERIVQEHQVQQVIFAIQDRRRNFPTDALLRVRLSGVEVLEEARVHEEITGRIPVEDLRPSSLIFSDGFAQGPSRRLMKRVFDILISATGLLVSAPITIATAIAIRIESPGPIFYGQRRVGLMGKEFMVWKFRSMRQDAEADGKPRFASVNDDRITRVGRFLRKTRIDEIPQMWNVLLGDMSFVGPRPERRFFVDQLRERIPFYDLRHVVKPGITGWAQVRYRYGAGELDAMRKLRYDMFYVKHQSILLDLRIILETVGVVFDGEMGR